MHGMYSIKYTELYEILGHLGLHSTGHNYTNIYFLSKTENP